MAEFTSLNGYMVKDATARNIAKGRNQAVAYGSYAEMIEALNAMDRDEFRTGQNIYIGTVGVPDLWVYSIEPIQHNFTYVSDEDAVEMLKNNTTIQVGFYRLAMLEGQKVDLTTVNAQLAEHENAIAAHDTKLSAHDTKFTEVDEAISEQNKNLSNLQLSLGTQVTYSLSGSTLTITTK